MPPLSLKERVASLEKQVEELQATILSKPRKKDWRRTIGMFTGDEVMKRIDEEARKYREADRHR
jgi:activator of HSP90 ATPase